MKTQFKFNFKNKTLLLLFISLLFNQITKAQNKSNIHFENGIKLQKSEKHNLAILEFNKAIEREPNCIKCYFERAYSRFLLNQKEDAIRDLNFIIDHKPNYSAYWLRAECNYFSENYKSALEDINLALDLIKFRNNEYYSILHLRGQIFSELNYIELAKNDYLNVIDKSNNNILVGSTYQQLGKLFENSQHDYISSIYYYKKAIASYQKNDDINTGVYILSIYKNILLCYFIMLSDKANYPDSLNIKKEACFVLNEMKMNFINEQINQYSNFNCQE